MLLYDSVQVLSTILSSKAPVEARLHDGLAVLVGGAVIEQLLAYSCPSLLVIRETLPLHFIGTSEMHVLQSLDLQGQTSHVV